MMYGVPSHRAVLEFVAQPPFLRAGRLQVKALAWDQLHDRRDSIDGHDRDLAHRIDRDPAPVGSPDVRRHDQRAPHAGRRKDPFVPQAAESPPGTRRDPPR